MTTEKLDPERAVRLLRAKASELEMEVLDEDISHGDIGQQGQLRADIALIAGLLADFMERIDPTVTLYVAHSENLIERVAVLEGIE
jgi:hypothetical protein